MRRDESWQGRRWLNEPKMEIEAQANVESDKADLQMWKLRRCRWSKLQYMHLISITESQLISVSTKNSTDSNSGSERNVNNVTPTSFIPWHFLIASHTRVNAMHSRATIMRRACIKMLLAHFCLPTQTPKSQFYSSFWCSTSISRKAVESLIWKFFFPQFLTFDVRFVRKGSNFRKKNVFLPQFFTFDVRFVRKGSNFRKKKTYSCFSFSRSTSVSCERVATKIWKSQVYLSFWRSTPQNRNFTSVFDLRRPFRAKRLRLAPQNCNLPPPP